MPESMPESVPVLNFKGGGIDDIAKVAAALVTERLPRGNVVPYVTHTISAHPATCNRISRASELAFNPDGSLWFPTVAGTMEVVPDPAQSEDVLLFARDGAVVASLTLT